MSLYCVLIGVVCNGDVARAATSPAWLSPPYRDVARPHTQYVTLVASSLIASVLCESGSCPPTLPVDQCNPTCGPNAKCEGKQLCCPTACGGAMCVDPMTQRTFVTLVKQGRCPEFPGGSWICTHTCTGDSDCPRKLKCCPNRCGALACQKPVLDETTQPALHNLNTTLLD